MAGLYWGQGVFRCLLSWGPEKQQAHSLGRRSFLSRWSTPVRNLQRRIREEQLLVPWGNYRSTSYQAKHFERRVVARILSSGIEAVMSSQPSCIMVAAGSFQQAAGCPVVGRLSGPVREPGTSPELRHCAVREAKGHVRRRNGVSRRVDKQGFSEELRDHQAQFLSGLPTFSKKTNSVILAYTCGKCMWKVYVG